ncbi:hypothetical protein GFS24_07500 [Chitinophaga sp. SYP-B3965]|uniref:retropepsin-like aspartic protease n=1 Tax=Chitinophaga sp. SYP-B3965 TaxID=2663120 RepID=UPI0012997870|nr:retropepsin-like aspartic protease [Chitinophaga sp. SYP-B3965]MRG44953.1 hypothetical protein [Chitinophaga sp. SYP-B3965]
MKRFLLIITMLACHFSYAQIVIPIEIMPEGHILVKATINGVEGNFIFDTGGGLHVVTKKFAEKLSNFPKQDGGFTGFRATGERIDADLYTAQTLTLGGFTDKNPTVAVIDANFGPIDGLISLMSFQNTPFTIDYTQNKLIIETDKSLAVRKKAAKAIIPLQLEKHRDKSLDIFAYFTLENKLTLQFLLDSGSGKNVFRLNAKNIPLLGINTGDTAKVKKISHRSEIDTSFSSSIYHTKVGSLAAKGAPGVKVEGFKASFVEGLIYDGIVSINWIGKQLTVDLQKREMLVVY